MTRLAFVAILKKKKIKDKFILWLVAMVTTHNND